MANNLLKNYIIEFHILQSFPVTCLNRDDVGAPKTAMIGGTTRARVSSQCWKRAVRLQMHALGAVCGDRTKAVHALIQKACLAEGSSKEQADACGLKIAEFFIGKEELLSKKENKTGSSKNKKVEIQEDNEVKAQEENKTLVFLSPADCQLIAKKFKELGFDPSDIKLDKEKDLKNLLKETPQIDAADIALFGRMLAKAPFMNVEAATCFSHAISTHKVQNEVEFFTALDTCSNEQGAAHLGSLEFNSATYYRYISLNLGQLYTTLGGSNIPEIVECFVKALFQAIPSGRQNTQSGASFWDFAKIFVRKGQRLQVPFTTAVRLENGGFLQPSIVELEKYLAEKEVMAGSLFQKVEEYTLGRQGSSFSIDDLINSLRQNMMEITG